MKHLFVVIVLSAIALSVTAVQAQWTPPMLLPGDTMADVGPSVVPIEDHGLVATWVSRTRMSTSAQIRGASFHGDSWEGPIPFSQPAPLIGPAPGISLDPASQGLRVSWYNGSFPTDDDTWGIYSTFADSAGVRPAELVFRDTAISQIVMRFNGAGRVGMLYTRAEGAGIDVHSSLRFSYRDGDSWTWPVWIARGSGSPLYMNYYQPSLSGDSANGFYMAYSFSVQGPPPLSEVHVIHYPDSTVIGRFPGKAPALVSNWHGALELAYLDTLNARSYLLGRTYRNGLWSTPDTLDSNVMPGPIPSLGYDTLGTLWLAYLSGYSTPPLKVLIRYKSNRWYEPDTIVIGGMATCPCVVSTYGNDIWVLWQTFQATQSRIYAARRLSYPGIAGARGREPRVARLEVRPTVSRGVFALVPPPGASVVTIYDASGKLKGRIPLSGRSPAIWDGADGCGHALPAGVYYLRPNGNRGGARVMLVR